jgi:peptidoglycan/xylan/chitin deacetylase (PgdA/CDA1 family)
MVNTLRLTFDDGPDVHWTRRILEALDRADARATFFTIGERVKAHPDTVLAILQAGHEVQLHCERHLRHSELSEAEIALDTAAGLRSLAEVGVRPTLWRTPWGVHTQASERVASSHGLRLIDWTIDTHDWRGDTASTMLDAIRPLLAPDGIVLMHDAIGPGALRAGCENTVELVGGLVAAARAEALRVAPVVETSHPGQDLELIAGGHVERLPC